MLLKFVNGTGAFLGGSEQVLRSNSVVSHQKFRRFIILKFYDECIWRMVQDEELMSL